MIELRFGRLRPSPAEAADNGTLPGDTAAPVLAAAREV
jgi:hypothetical protein